MEKRETAALKVLSDFNAPEDIIVINPNDGFDIGLMMTEARVRLSFSQAPDPAAEAAACIEGMIVQKNECRLGTVEISSRSLEKIGSPRTVKLHLLPASPGPVLFVSPG